MSLAGTSANLGRNGTGLAVSDARYAIVAHDQDPIVDTRLGCLADFDTCSPFVIHSGLGMVAYFDFVAFVSCLHGHSRPY